MLHLQKRGGGFFEAVFRPVTKFLKLPACCGAALLAAAVGGYPVAAKAINDLVCDGRLSPERGSKMLCYCVNAGPPFLIGAVGGAVFGSLKIGILLWTAQALSCLIIAGAVSLFGTAGKGPHRKNDPPRKFRVHR